MPCPLSFSTLFANLCPILPSVTSLQPVGKWLLRQGIVGLKLLGLSSKRLAEIAVILVDVDVIMMLVLFLVMIP